MDTPPPLNRIQLPEERSLAALYVWLDERLIQLRTSQLDDHARLRADMAARFADMQLRLDASFIKTQLIMDRTLTIEIERRMERQQSMRIGALWGSAAGAIAAGIISFILRAFRL